MTAQSSGRDAAPRSGGSKPEYFPVDLPLASGVTIYGHAIVAVDTSGNARPGRASTSDKILGISEETVINPSGGTKRTRGIRRCVASFKNAAGDALTAAHIGNAAYVHDDQTFGASAGGARVQGGIFVGFDPDVSGNVLVQVG